MERIPAGLCSYRKPGAAKTWLLFRGGCCLNGVLCCMQIACMLVASFGDAATAARFNTALQWLSVLRLVRLPKAFSIVKASHLPRQLPHQSGLSLATTLPEHLLGSSEAEPLLSAQVCMIE